MDMVTSCMPFSLNSWIISADITSVHLAANQKSLQRVGYVISLRGEGCSELVTTWRGHPDLAKQWYGHPDLAKVQQKCVQRIEYSLNVMISNKYVMY